MPKRPLKISQPTPNNLALAGSLDAILKHGDARRYIDSLNEHEKAVAIDILRELVSDVDSKSPTLESLWEIDYRHRPVDIDTFLDDDENFLGKKLRKPDGSKVLFDCWRDDLRRVFQVGSQVSEWLMRGAIGTGKSTTAAIAMGFTVYRLACLRDPHAYYNLIANSKIVFGAYSLTRSQAADVGFFKIKDIIDSVPWFSRNYPRDSQYESSVQFESGRIAILSGSRAFHAIGQDLFGAYIDEANFMQKGREAYSTRTENEVLGQAKELLENVYNRIMSRFMRPGGTIPGLLTVLSSERGVADFLAEHVKEVQPEITKGRVFVSSYSQWEVHPISRYCGKRFRVQVGDTIFPSRILKDGEDGAVGCQVIDVPIEYETRFRMNIEGSIREIAGIPTTGILPLIRDKQILFKCVDSEMDHPFTRSEIVLEPSMSLDDFFLPEKMFTVEMSRYVPRFHPNSIRFAHVDIGLTADACGIGIAHVAGMTDALRYRADGTSYVAPVPIIYYDVLLRVIPPSGGELDLSKIRAFLVSLKEMGLPIVVVSFDGYQSADSRQILEKSGFETVLLSIDRTDEPYLMLRQSFQEGRIHMYRYDPFLREMMFLERDLDKKKVDHPKKNPDGTPGSKDVADGGAGAVFHCLSDPRAFVKATAIAVPSRSNTVLPLQSAPSGMSLEWSEYEKEYARDSK